MARQTKAQRAAEEEAAIAALWQEFTAGYAKRLTLVVYNFGRLADAQFSVLFMPATETFRLQSNQDWHSEWELPLTLPENRDMNLTWDLADAESAVQRYMKEEEQRAEMERKRVAALNKLTDEERALLGL